jgi:hypothetical protein
MVVFHGWGLNHVYYKDYDVCENIMHNWTMNNMLDKNNMSSTFGTW